MVGGPAQVEIRAHGRCAPWPGKDDDHEGLVLNRVVRWTSGGLEYEADPRQAEKLIRDTEPQGANAVTTPGVKPLPHQLEQEQPLSIADFI